jgi:hypothetical protein
MTDVQYVFAILKYEERARVGTAERLCVQSKVNINTYTAQCMTSLECDSHVRRWRVAEPQRQ